MTLNRKLIILGVTVVTVGGVFLTYLAEQSPEIFSEKGMWRIRLAERKLTGGVPDLSWSELIFMVRTPGGFGLEGVVSRGQSLYGAIDNPFNLNENHEKGEHLFREHCSGCHGAEARGAHAPSLLGNLSHGDSDFAIYRAIRDGIANTGMAAVTLSPDDRWQVVGYLRAMQRSVVTGSQEGLRRDIHVNTEQIYAGEIDSSQWLTYSGSINGQRYSPLTEISRANVSRLRLKWVHQLETPERLVEATPIVANGVIFTTEPPSNVVALDERSGDVLWRYQRNVPGNLPACCSRVNRGLAVLGDQLFLGSLDGVLVALEANSGKVAWQTRVADPSNGFTITGAPLIVGKSVVVGVAGGEYGIRGFLAAYDSDTGKMLWKFNTIPEPGEPGHESWKNDAWRTGGGPTWVTGSYDPKLDLLYWGVGNPSPDFNGDVRPGDNLFTDSMISLHGATGKLAWYFQFTPHDEHDWDSNQTPILVDLDFDGQKRRVLCTANRNGFYYVLDRTTGAFLTGVPFTEQNWAKGLDENGRPILAAASVSQSGHSTKPGVEGGTNWQNGAFDPKTGLFFVPATEGVSIFTKSNEVTRGPLGLSLASAGTATVATTEVVRALDAATGGARWHYYPPHAVNVSHGGLLATAGGMVFGTAGGNVFGLDSGTGKELWRVRLGPESHAAPISFTVDGHQVLLVSAGKALFSFGL